jgi:diguanylate cyclase (GGDEF)-like protein/PAS domain S-box-containing protein
MQQTPHEENLTQLLQAIAGDMVLRWLPDGTVISANSILCECLGASEKDLYEDLYFAYVFDPDHARLMEYLSTFSQQDSRNSIDYRLITKNGEVQWMHWRDFYHYNSDLQRYEFLSIGHKISERSISLSLVTHIENFNRLITELSVNFINIEPENLDEEIQKSLQMVGELAMVDRSYVFLYRQDGNSMDNTHEWCAPGIEPQKSHLQNLPVNSIPWWHKIISNLETIHIPDVDEMPSEASAEKEILKMQSIRSLVVVPIDYMQTLIGFLGFDAVRFQKNWSEKDMALLRIFGSIIGRAINQVKKKNELLARERFLQKLNEISLSSLNSKNIQEFLDEVVNQLEYIITANGCFITLWDDQKNVVIPCAASEPFSQTYKNLQIQPGEKTVTEHILETQEILIIDHVEQSPFLSSRIANSFSSHCLLGVPLMAENRKLGAILLGFDETHNFTQEEISLVQQAAYLVSTTLSKQIGREEAEKNARELETLRKTGMVIASTLELELAIDRILDQLDQVIPSDYATIQMLVDQQLEIRAGKGWPDALRIKGRRIPIPGDNPNTWVIQNRQPLCLADAQVDYKSFRDLPNIDIHSWIGAPLIVKDELIGMITLEKSEVGFYHPYHLKIISAFTDQVAIFLFNAQTYKNEQQRVMELNALRDTLNDISNELELSQLLPAIVKRATTLMNANGGELGLYDPEKKEIRVVVSQGIGKNLTGTILAVKEGLFGKVIETHQPLITQNYMDWDNRIPLYESEVIKAVIAVPLLIGKQLLGVIGIARTESNEPFTENDQDLLLLFARQAAIAINNANFYNEVENLTKIDPLTGAYNRRGLNELFHHELARTHRTDQPMAMLMVDIDYFKFVNDHYGHPIGDQILILLSDELQKNLRETDILCRYGGEEFAVLLPETNLQTAKNIAERLRINIANKPFDVPSMEVNITISIGVSWMPGKIASIETLIERADEAMYQAKRSGRNMVCVFNEI